MTDLDSPAPYPFTRSVNVAAGLPFHLTVQSIIDMLDGPEYLRVVAGHTEFAAMSFDEAHRLGSVGTALELARRAREAYQAGVLPDAAKGA